MNSGVPLASPAMDRPPLPEPVARRARSYLAALVPAGRTSDAWHELVADVTYWGDREELPVLRLAHQVVLQHERVTEEVAALALDELGISSPRSVAAVLDVSPAHAEALLDRVATLVAEDGRPSDVHVFDAEAGAVEDRPVAHEADDPAPGGADDPDPAEDDPDAGEADHPDVGGGDDAAPEAAGPVAPVAVPPDTEASATDVADADARAPDAPAPEGAEPDATAQPAADPGATRAVRIGFEDDDVIEVGGWDDDGAGLDARRWVAIIAVVVGAAILLWVLTG